MASPTRVLVTGGNAGIGFALCRQLAVENNCHVFLGSRNAAKGQRAVEAIAAAAPQVADRVEFVEIDTGDDASVMAAAEAVRTKLGGEPLHAIVNNAGTGLAHGVSNATVMNTNLQGPRRVCEAFIPMLPATGGRIVNVGSGSGPMYLQQQSEDVKRMLSNPDVTWEQIDGLCRAEMQRQNYNSYGLSKCCLASYTMVLAKAYPNIMCSSLSPGFIDTAIVKGFGASKKPEDVTVIRHCLFADLPVSGWFWSSDSKRGPMHVSRQPGDRDYNGEWDWRK